MQPDYSHDRKERSYPDSRDPAQKNLKISERVYELLHRIINYSESEVSSHIPGHVDEPVELIQRDLDELFEAIRIEIFKRTVDEVKDVSMETDRYEKSKLVAVRLKNFEQLKKISQARLIELLKEFEGVIINPTEEQLKAIVYGIGIITQRPNYSKEALPGVFSRWSPRAGAFIFGPPGTGKTHILAVMYRELKRFAERELCDFEDFTRRSILRFVKELIDDVHQGRCLISRNDSYSARGPYTVDSDDQPKIISVEEAVENFINYFISEMWSTVPVSPTDFIFVNFDRLCELKRERPELYQKIKRAKYLFVDDVPQLNDESKLEVFCELIQDRYTNQLYGTFMTSNCSPEELIKGEKLRDTVLSRIGESMLIFNFSGAIDFRREALRQVTVCTVEEQISKDLAKLEVKEIELPTEQSEA